MPDKVEYWLELCDDDTKAAKAMLESKNFLWMGFICHLVAEKALKAAFVNDANDDPPKTHDLLRLAALSDTCLNLPNKFKTLLGNLSPLQIEARYPEYKAKIAAVLTESYCDTLLQETEEFLCWIKEKLGRQL
ncbi:MAG: HEPN domain-containing protein [Oscillospiraceae bacterium]|jgi:HEPN domain-containing protein|nr:HEPN domain-containing protein [Oscillospiraceae bacterium]